MIRRLGEPRAAAAPLPGARCPVPIVFDHLGRVRGGERVDAPGFKVVRRLLAEREDCWTTMASWYRPSDTGPPGFENMAPLVKVLLRERPDRCFWGHQLAASRPDRLHANDIDLIDQLDGWIEDDRVCAML